MVPNIRDAGTVLGERRHADVLEWPETCSLPAATTHTHHSQHTGRNPMSSENPAISLVREFLDATMAPDPQKAETYISPDLQITFTGGRQFHHPREIAAFNGRRYQWVKKELGPFDVCEMPQGTVVYSLGTLYGAWPDGTPFENNRFIDRFLIRDGKIVRMDVWNDSAERLLDAQ